MKKNYGSVLGHINTIVERGFQNYPELDVRNNTGIDAGSIGNSAALKDSCLIEAFNLNVGHSDSLKNVTFSVGRNRMRCKVLNQPRLAQIRVKPNGRWLICLQEEKTNLIQ